MVVAFSDKLNAYGILVDTLVEALAIAGHEKYDFTFETRWADIKHFERKMK